MKKSQIVLISIIVILTALVYWRLSSTKKEVDTTKKSAQSSKYVPVRKVENSLRKMEMVSYGQVTPVVQIDLAFEVQGKLLRGNKTLKAGSKFRKGERLFSVDSKENLLTLNARKTSFANLIIGILPDIELDFQKELNKWIDFLNNIQANKPLPNLPKISNGKERMFVTSRNIISEYYNVKSLEERNKKYTYFAPFSGTVVEVYTEPGSIISPGKRVATIANTSNYEVKVPISMEQLNIYKEKGKASFYNSDNNLVGTGKIIRVSDVVNQNTQSADAYYSIKAVEGEQVYHGMFVNAKINRSTEQISMAIPRLAIKDGKVKLLKDGKLINRNVVEVSSKPDTVFVRGLKNGELVLLESVQASNEISEYKGIER